MTYLFIVGLVSILGQTVLLRELSVAFYGIELIYLLALGVWLLWTAAGAAIRTRRAGTSAGKVQLLFALLAVLLPLDVAFIRSIRLVFSGVPGAFLPFGEQMLALILALMPVGLLSGLLFRLSAGLFMARGGSLAFAYAMESAGGLVGGLCATLLLKFGVQNFTAVLLCSLTAAAAPILASSGRERRQGLALGALPAFSLVLVLWNGGAIDRLMTSWTHPNLVATEDSPYSRVTVTRMDGQVSVFENDALSFGSEETEAEEFVHLSALEHPRPASVLILGGGIEGTVREILKHSPRRIDYVEPDPVVLSLVPSQLPEEMRAPLADSRVRVAASDPRRFLSSHGAYDLILIGMGEPSSGRTNRFYSLEFFRLCAAHLNRGGVLAFRLSSSENFWTPQLTRRNASIYRAVKAAFPEVLVLPGTTNTIVAGKERLTRDPGVLAERFERRKIRAKLVSPPYIRYLLTNDRFARIAAALEAEDAPRNTDNRPICYQYTLVLWLSQFFPGLGNTDLSLSAMIPEWKSPGLWAAVLGLALLFAWARRRTAAARVLLVAVAGFVGMVLETLLLLRYQIKSGILFQDIGMLLMTFMAGMTAGSAAAGRPARPVSARASRISGGAAVLSFVLLCLSVGLLIDADRVTGLFSTGALLFLDGFLVGTIFVYAGNLETRDPSSVIGPLYAADLIGGCFGSLGAALLLLPLAGLAPTAYLMLPLAALSALLIK